MAITGGVAAQAQKHAGDVADRRRSGAIARARDQVGHVYTSSSPVMSRCGGSRSAASVLLVRRQGHRLCPRARRRHVSPPTAPGPALVGLRWRPLPRDPGQRRHELGHGRREAARRRCRHRRLAKHRGQSGRRRRPRGGAVAGVPRLRRHRLGMDPPGRAVHVSTLPQPVRLQPRSEQGERTVPYRRAGRRRPPAPRRARRHQGGDGDPQPARGRGDRLMGHTP